MFDFLRKKTKNGEREKIEIFNTITEKSEVFTPINDRNHLIEKNLELCKDK